MPGGITPDGSVRWFIEALKAEKEMTNGSKLRLDGRDPTNRGDFLKVSIRIPSNQVNREKFIAQLRAQLDNATTHVTLYMPNEDESNGYAPGAGNRPFQSDNLDVELLEPEWQIYFDWSITKPDLPDNLKDGWRFGDQTAI
jgi:hypothetical protein